MRFKNCTLAYVKNLYMKKVKAVDKNDQETIQYLQLNFPELFNAQFLMDVLRNEFERDRNGADNNIPSCGFGKFVWFTQCFRNHTNL
jgi:hypothetical protein